MKSFNVLKYNVSSKTFEPYDVIPYLVDAYQENLNNKYCNIPKTFKEFKSFVKSESKYAFMSRCECEIILVDWPCQIHEEKWDIYDQIMMNLDIIVKIFKDEIVKIFKDEK